MKPTALVTGSSSGIGAAVVSLFAAAGWRVLGIDHSPAENAGCAERSIRADVSSVHDMAQAFEIVFSMTDRLDVLVNNAGVQLVKPLLETSPEEWDSVLAANLRSVFLGVRHAQPLLRVAGGSIVNIASVHAHSTSAGLAAYVASKGAVVALTRALALELAHDGIRVNAVLPGAVDTAMLRAGLLRGPIDGLTEEELLMRLAQRHPLGRIGEPWEIAEAVLFLADPKRSSFITGQSLIVDGGATAKLSTE